MELIIENIINSLYSKEEHNKEYSRIYKIHKYWARKPWYIVEKYIKNYSDVGSVVMDPFCGSGCTGLESVINGRDFIGQDLNPTALRVSEGTLMDDIDFNQFDEDFLNIKSAVKEKIMALYKSSHKCPNCAKQLYYKHICIGPAYKGSYVGKAYCDSCKSKTFNIALSEEEITTNSEINNTVINTWIPNTSFPQKFYKDRFSYKGVSSVNDMFTKRNLYALSLLFDAINAPSIKYKKLYTLAFTNTVLHASKLKGENVRPLGVNNYWIPDDYIEENVWFRFTDRVKNIRSGKLAQLKRQQEKVKLGFTTGSWLLRKKSALDDMGTECIDYFFTDPPYGDAIQYSELSYIWNAWLNEEYDNCEEIIINPVQNKGENEFELLLSKSLENIYKALKTGCYFTLCFQNKNFSIWKSVIEKCKALGFCLIDVSIYDTYGSPFNKSWANFSPKSDIYVTFKKTNSINNSEYFAYESIETIISEIYHYTKNHNIDLDNNKLYDLSIAYLIWALFLNKCDINIKNFNIKSFSKIAENLIRDENKNTNA